MDILHQIGINATAAIQFVFFALALLFLNKVVFTPYAHAFEERQKRTEGGENLALEFQKKSIELQSEYELKARAINSKTKEIFDASKAEANKSYEAAVGKSRDQANALVAENRKKLTDSVQAASSELKKQTGLIAMAITNKLLGK